MGGLSWATTKGRSFSTLYLLTMSVRFLRLIEGLKAHFEKYGAVSDCVIMMDPITKRPR